MNQNAFKTEASSWMLCHVHNYYLDLKKIYKKNNSYLIFTGIIIQRICFTFIVKIKKIIRCSHHCLSKTKLRINVYNQSRQLWCFWFCKDFYWQVGHVLKDIHPPDQYQHQIDGFHLWLFFFQDRIVQKK